LLLIKCTGRTSFVLNSRNDRFSAIVDLIVLYSIAINEDAVIAQQSIDSGGVFLQIGDQPGGKAACMAGGVRV
jgi:hypothetical protein